MEKILLTLIFLTFLTSLSKETMAQSSALYQVLEALQNGRDDLPNGFVEIRLIKKIPYGFPEAKSCESVSKDKILEHYERGVRYYQNFYYDHNLPYEKSRNIFAEVLGDKNYLVCIGDMVLDNPYYQKIWQVIYAPVGDTTPIFLFEEGVR